MPCIRIGLHRKGSGQSLCRPARARPRSCCRCSFRHAVAGPWLLSRRMHYVVRSLKSSYPSAFSASRAVKFSTLKLDIRLSECWSTFLAPWMRWTRSSRDATSSSRQVRLPGSRMMRFRTAWSITARIFSSMKLTTPKRRHGLRSKTSSVTVGFCCSLPRRVETVERAKRVHERYKSYTEFKPVQLHTGIKSVKAREQARHKITSGESRIVVCVDMLGEGFDLPELKIAAFHDIRKTLAVTLQLAGRFTRSRPDLGDATFIANTADVDVQAELRKLYSRDPDWNVLLPDLSDKLIGEQ